jgi:hypothetical protein
MQLLLNDSANYARVISHLAAYDAAPRLFEHLLAADPQNIAGAPGVKVIMDFTHTGEEIEVYRD